MDKKSDFGLDEENKRDWSQILTILTKEQKSKEEYYLYEKKYSDFEEFKQPEEFDLPEQPKFRTFLQKTAFKPQPIKKESNNAHEIISSLAVYMAAFFEEHPEMATHFRASAQIAEPLHIKPNADRIIENKVYYFRKPLEDYELPIPEKINKLTKQPAQPKIKQQLTQQEPMISIKIDSCIDDIRFSTFAEDATKISEKPNKNLEDALKQFSERETLSKQETKDLTDKFKKEGAEINPADHTIKRDYDHGYSRSFRHIYHDAYYSFVLCYQERGIATIAFDAEHGGILVKQIQGVQGEKDILRKIKWERMLLALVCKWAKEQEIPEVRVLPHKRNQWTKVQQHGKVLYDVTAERSGFKYDDKRQVYFKIV